MEEQNCYHCGTIGETIIHFDEKPFCCNGCKTVYEILNGSALSKYYELEKAPGRTPEEVTGKYDYLDNEQILNQLIEFVNDDVQIVNLSIPHIHCSSCIWVLENLGKLNTNIVSAQVNFPKKTARITYNHNEINLKGVVELLSSIGYDPYISLDDADKKDKQVKRGLLYKLAIAGFAFGNVMLLSFPEYFELNEYWLDQYKPFFHYIMLFFSLPVVFYASVDYFISAYKGLSNKILNIDVPIALGIVVLFLRSLYEIVTHTGQGFLDSLCGLVFFLLVGKFFQQKTYHFLSFERDYKSYFPIAVTKLMGDKEANVPVHEVKKGDRLLIRNEELIPIDAILIKGDARLDYSFVTGESKTVRKTSGDQLYAGGKQTEGSIEIEAVKEISQSYLTQLWSNEVFQENKEERLESMTNAISKYFTVIILLITFVTALFWYFVDTSIMVNAVTAVLIVACPCALALSAPFTLGNLLRILGKAKLYVKNARIIEVLPRVSTMVFDKTGTLTHSQKSKISYSGCKLKEDELIMIKSVLRGSNHPLSRMLYEHLGGKTIEVSDFKEIVGKGLSAHVDAVAIKIGSSSFIGISELDPIEDTQVHIQMGKKYKGCYTIKNVYRDGVASIFSDLSSLNRLVVLSGDNAGERQVLEEMLPKHTVLEFNKKPEEKLSYIKSLQEKGESVMMIGDGLNDAGALAQSDVGVVIAEDVNVFSPACDIIIDASKFKRITSMLHLGKLARKLIIASFVLSFLYNVVGLSFAVTGNLSPVIAAILMPLSSVSVVVFVTIMSNYFSRRVGF